MHNWPVYIVRLLGLVAAIAVCTGVFHCLQIGCLGKFIGIPTCPFCGMTRAFIAAIQGDFRLMMEYNPLAPLFALAMLLMPLRREELSSGKWLAVNIALGMIGVLFGIRWVLLSI